MSANISINAAQGVQLNMASASAAGTSATMAGQGALRQQAMHAQAMKDASPSRCISSGAITHVPSPHKGLRKVRLSLSLLSLLYTAILKTACAPHKSSEKRSSIKVAWAR